MRRLRSLAWRSVQSAGGRLETQGGDPPVFGREVRFRAANEIAVQFPNTCQGVVHVSQQWGYAGGAAPGSIGPWIVLAGAWGFSTTRGDPCGGSSGPVVILPYYSASAGFVQAGAPWTGALWHNVGLFPFGTIVTVRELL
jgi:hypothetical protein